MNCIEIKFQFGIVIYFIKKKIKKCQAQRVFPEMRTRLAVRTHRMSLLVDAK